MPDLMAIIFDRWWCNGQQFYMGANLLTQVQFPAFTGCVDLGKGLDQR